MAQQLARSDCSGPLCSTRLSANIAPTIRFAVSAEEQIKNARSGSTRAAIGLGKRLAAAERAGMRWQAVEAIRLIALTGCRRGEIQQLRRAEIDRGRPSSAPGRHQDGLQRASDWPRRGLHATPSDGLRQE